MKILIFFSSIFNQKIHETNNFAHHKQVMWLKNANWTANQLMKTFIVENWCAHRLSSTCRAMNNIYRIYFSVLVSVVGSGYENTMNKLSLSKETTCEHWGNDSVGTLNELLVLPRATWLWFLRVKNFILSLWAFKLCGNWRKIY